MGDETCIELVAYLYLTGCSSCVELLVLTVALVPVAAVLQNLLIVASLILVGYKPF